MINKFFFKYYLRLDEDVPAYLGTNIQPGGTYVILNTRELWDKEPAIIKRRAIFTRKWNPSDPIIQKMAEEAFLRTIFGFPEDYASHLYNLNLEHNSRQWELNDLSAEDNVKIQALNSMTILTRLRYKERSRNLNLNLGKNYPMVCGLVYPMIIRCPVISMQYYLDVHAAFLFNSIRHCKHPYADDLISYLYELLTMQQKIAISLHEYLRLFHFTKKQKGEALFIAAEVDAISKADLIFSYLKAFVEKMMVVLALNFGIEKLESKKTHRLKINALLANIPKEFIELPYCQFLLELLQSENLEELNSYRSGLLHKKGIADLQPHNYVGMKPESESFKKIFQVLHEQHCKNTAGFIATLALLVDVMVKVDNPTEADFNLMEKAQRIFIHCSDINTSDASQQNKSH